MRTAVLAAAAVGLCATTGQSARSGVQPGATALEITRGTFLNLDVSPDGRTIVFDLLGDLYLLPITGGKATPFLTGRDWDQAPRFSPDGKTVAFVSDRSGIENVWIVPLASKQPERLTNLQEPVAGTPSWSPDGRELLFGMRSVSARLQLVSRDSHEIRPLERQRAGALGDEPYTYNYVAATSGVTAANGVTYFSEIHVVHPRPGFHHGSRSLLVALDTHDGSRRVLTDLIQLHNESKPQLSASGRLLAYYRANGDGATELRVRDLQANTDRYLTDVPNTDDPYRWGDRGDPMPTFAFDKNEEAIIAAFGGRIYRISIGDGLRSEIPFHVSAELDIAPRAVPRRRLVDGPLEVKAIRWPSFSRDRRRAAFSALGSIWIQDLPSADPRRLTAGAAFEHMPAISPDGQSVVYVSSGDLSARGQLMLARVDGTGRRPIVEGDFAYFAPAWSHDGAKIGFVRQGHPSGRLRDPRRDVMEYGWLDLQQHVETIVATVPKGPIFMSPLSLHVSFSEDDRELLCTAAPELLQTVVFAVSLDGRSRRELATAGRDVLGAVPSGNGHSIAFIGWNEDLWLATIGRNSQPRELRPDPRSATLVTADATTFLSWNASNELLVANGGRVTHVDAADLRHRTSTTLRLTVPRHEGTGTLALVNARVVTVAGDHGAGPVIDRGTVIIGGRRITAVGPAGELTVPRDAVVIDASGLTILPGFHDAHYHTIGQDAGFSPREDRTAVAFGLTSAWDALTGYGDMSLAAEEMRAVGRLAGPRWFFAGRSIEHFVGQVRGPDDARSGTRRHAAIGVELLKDYNVLERHVRRWYADAARAEGLGITAHFEGLGEMLSRVADGYTALEHSQFYTSLEDDVLALLARTGTILTPHALIADGSSSVDSEPLRLYFEELQRRKPAQVARIRPYVGTGTFSNWTTPTDKPLERIRAFKVARMCAAIVRAGGRIAVSGHNAPGILAHVEMWLLWKGGVPPEEAIRAATRTGIEKIGYLDDLGSIEPGKIADLVVLSSDPLADMLNTVDVRYTIVDGVVYDANANREVLPPPSR
jgi:imidazolonepropionase-like amidohydrolase/dipeptidyl aminopeptidase/acylaminoacyl peptidase